MQISWRTLTANRPRTIQTYVGAGALALGVWWLRVSGLDRALGWSVLSFGAYVSGRLVFTIAVSRAADQAAKIDEATTQRVLQGNQAAILTLVGTTVGLLAAFTSGPLAPATRVASVSLVGAALVHLTVHGTGARHLGGRAWNLGLLGDLLAEYLLSFGLIALVAALVVRSGGA